MGSLIAQSQAVHDSRFTIAVVPCEKSDPIMKAIRIRLDACLLRLEYRPSAHRSIGMPSSSMRNKSCWSPSGCNVGSRMTQQHNVEGNITHSQALGKRAIIQIYTGWDSSVPSLASGVPSQGVQEDRNETLFIMAENLFFLSMRQAMRRAIIKPAISGTILCQELKMATTGTRYGFGWYW